MTNALRKRKERVTPRSARKKPDKFPARDSSQLVTPPQFSRPFWLAKVLRERIIKGRYQPGERVREVDLRNEFGFSNGPIREALHLIVADGLAERAPWQGVRVVALDEQQIVELFQVRLALLEYAAELAARNITDEQVSDATTLQKKFVHAFSKSELGTQPSSEGVLSKWLLGVAGNEHLKALWERTMLRTLIYVNASFQQSRGAKSSKLVDKLIRAVVARDVVTARAAARALTQQILLDLGIKEAI